MKPEEIVRQNYIKVLNEDFDYPLEHIEKEVSIQRGNEANRKNTRDRADIVIYNDAKNRDQYKDILAIVETKSPDQRDGRIQLASYMSACSCQWGVWTNGIDSQYFIKEALTSKIKETFSIPKYNETIETIGEYTKDKLKPLRNLKPVFKKIFTTLYSNTNISRREKLGSEMIKLIFCKIWDEKYYKDSIPQFRFSVEEAQRDNYQDCQERICGLFENVKKELQADGIFSKNDEITLDAKSICKVVGALQQFSLMKTEKDAVGEAFEIFAESKLVGEKGEFFTPREIVKLAIQILDPSPEETIFDPACGSGGFLIYALDHIWKKMDHDKKYKGVDNLEGLKKNLASRCIFGADKEHDLVRIARAYMSLIGDGKSNIFQENMLHPIDEFQSKARDTLLSAKNKLRQFDYVVTNPPFGSKIKVLKSDSGYFDLGHVWKKDNHDEWLKTSKSKETEPQALFIELCLRFLKDGGKLAIVLPETYLHAPKARYIMAYIKNSCNITHIIDLPHNTFRPYCNAKTCLIVLEKARPQQEKIQMGVAEQMGHDHNGNDIYRIDDKKQVKTTEIWDDTVIIRNELLKSDEKAKEYTFLHLEKNTKNFVYVPRYYWGKKFDECRQVAAKEGYVLVPFFKLLNENVIKSFTGHGSPSADYKGIGDVPYIRVSDIVNWEIFKNPNTFIPFHEYTRIKRNSISLQEKDILFIRRGSYRIGSCAMVSKYDLQCLLMREIQVFRVTDSNNSYNITPFNFIYMLSHFLSQQQIFNKVFIDTTLPNLGERWKEIYLPIYNNPKKMLELSSRIKAIFDYKWKASSILLKTGEITL